MKVKRPDSGRLKAGPAQEAAGGDKHSIDHFDRQPRESARRGPADDATSLPGVELRFVARAPESSHLGLPQGDVAASVRAHTRIRHDTIGRAPRVSSSSSVAGKSDEQDLVQPRAVADDAAAGVDGIGQRRRAARQKIGGRDDLSDSLSAGEHEAIAGLGTLRAGITSLGGGAAGRAERHASAKSGS